MPYLDLVQGQVVYLLGGVGLPRVTGCSGTYAVVARVEEEFAVTAGGRLLTERDNDGVVIPTSKLILTPDQYYLSAKALQVHNGLNLPVEPATTELFQEQS